jgi:hypothetical protein
MFGACRRDCRTLEPPSTKVWANDGAVGVLNTVKRPKHGENLSREPRDRT